MSVKQFAGHVIAGVVLSGAAIPTVSAASLMVNQQSLSVQTPTLAGTSGITYQAAAPTSTVSVYTSGFLFCANVLAGASPPSPPPPSWNVTFVPKHEDQSFSPAHAWAMPTASDISSVAYTGSVLSINRNPAGNIMTTLVCRGVGAQGELPSGIADGIFDNGEDSAAATHYGHLINWIPQGTFDWNAPDWTQVPTDPCYSSANQPARMVETAACAAATGVRPGTSAPAVRSGTVWTASDGVSFTYLFRVDLRFGPQPPTAMPHFQLPTRTADAASSAGAAYAVLRDAYDSTYLGDGHFCFLADATPPAALNVGTCAAAGATSYTMTGAMDFPFSVFAPPVGPGATSFYVVINRQIGSGSHTNLATPVVGVAVLVDPALSAESGDAFIGDDVAFGFMPTSAGFPWMSGQ